jgi:WD40 repeat protein
MKKLITVLLLFPLFIFSQDVEVVIQNGHPMPFDFDFSPDGKYAATGSWDNHVKLWDLKTGYEFKTFTKHNEFVTKVRFSPDGKTLASAGNDQKICLWNLDSLKFESVIETNCSTLTMEFGHKNQVLASGGTDSVLYVWDYWYGELYHAFKGHKGKINCIAFMPKMTHVLTGSADSTVKMWNLSNFEETATFEYSSPVKHIKVSKTGKYFFVMEADADIHVYSIESGNRLYYLKGDCEDIAGIWQASEPSFSNDERFLYFIDNDRMIKVFDLEKDEFYRFKTFHKNRFVQGIKVNPANGHLASFSEDLTVSLMRTRKINDSTLRYVEYNRLEGYTDPPFNLAFSNDSTYLMIAGLDINLLNLKTGGIIHVASNISGFQNVVKFSYNSEKLIFFDTNGDVVFYDIASGKTTKKIPFGQYPDRIDISNDLKIISIQKFDSLLVYDLSQEKFVVKIPVYNSRSRARAHMLSPDGSTLYYANSNNDILVYDIESNKVIAKFTGHTDVVTDISIRTDGKYLSSSCEDYRVLVWDVKNHKLLQTLDGHSYEAMITKFSPDGNLIISGSLDFTTIIWDWKSGIKLKQFDDQKNMISAVAISPDNRLLATGSLDLSLNIYDVQKHKKLLTIYPMKEGELVVLNNENYYLASPMATDKIIFAKGYNLFPFEQFDLQYNRPHEILKDFGFASTHVIKAYEKAYQKRLQKSGFQDDLFKNDFHIPSINIIEKETDEYITESKNYKIKIKAVDTKYQLDKINIWINDVPVFGSNGYSIKHFKTMEFEDEFNLKLSIGTNKIKISCLNEKGAESLKEFFEVYCHISNAKKPDLYLISISVSKYLDTRMDLQYAAKDGRDMISTYSKREKAFNQIHFDTLYNENATKENFLKIREKLLNTSPDDYVIMFVSGHGLLNEQFDFYYATHDVDFSYPEYMGLAYDAFEQMLDSIPARKKLLLIDACHSGEVDKDEVMQVSTSNVLLADGTKSGLKTYRYGSQQSVQNLSVNSTFELMQNLFTNLNKGSGTVVISAAAGTGYALESGEWNNGVFTYAVLNGLKNKMADFDKDNHISVSELLQYVSEEVKFITNGSQRPTSRAVNLDNDFSIW